ncbi:MAG: DUF2799 domain-containing protein [Hoeflea sp.]|uniref:DUF2799 domain-containing protein n=1 Tax=Hoeflea sp. TaxID=1940281 RepID=UPI001DCC01F1|nr:DUF2799 domain-containing protein [Hoeflea sp.]MBU4527331.1 DUF2799 domain-containing protein [Alphaproteobacteria bacterium]MBU4546886.1 DUF2799 domain-containing protein [Alphaproteobacteria bacterium]MBU4551602.1 DUF2799 domain-containing protein [Alphaproteobacteria bacterium]MBV1725607.1 DUF2799 domain-containing protein [Hoeflea sp.]MBV1759655.1 DUF2799 domain-containing protein [Hoeflea sp.]
MKLRFALLMSLCALASSCQTLSKEECAVADWRVIGEQDGAAGYNPQDRFARHVKACTKAGVAADQTLWYQGYQQGLPRYCTPLNGLTVGSEGKSYANVCPIDLDAGFREGYDLGRIYHQKKSEISSLESRTRAVEQEIRADEELIRATKTDPREIYRRIDANRWKIRDMERETGRLQSELRRIEADMDNFRYSYASRT